MAALTDRKVHLFLFLLLFSAVVSAELGRPKMGAPTTKPHAVKPAAPAHRPGVPAAVSQPPRVVADENEVDEEEEEQEGDTTVTAPRTPASTQRAAAVAQPKEEEAEDDSEEREDVENPEAKQKMLERLVRKFTLPNKKMASIVFLAPVTYVDPRMSDIVLATMHKAFSRYGEFNIRVKEAKLAALTLEGFRGVIAKVKADVIFATVLKPTHFDLFVFDRRSPYYVFYHTEVHPEEKSGPAPMTEELAIDQTRILLRRGLYLYLTNQFYELPRENREVVMEAQIPRWMASAQTVEEVNRSMNRRFYGAASVGGALSRTNDDRSWSGGVFGVQIAARPYGHFYVEATYEAFAYNVFMGAVRYNLSDKYSSLQILPGLGFAFLTQRKSLEVDQNLTLHKNHNYIVPSILALLPLGDVYFKVESQLLVAMTTDRFVLNFLPGLLFQF